MKRVAITCGAVAIALACVAPKPAAAGDNFVPALFGGLALGTLFGIAAASCTASENTAPVPFESAYAIWTSWQHSCDRDDQALMQRGDRVGNVTLGPDRRRRGVGNYREWQVF